MQLLAAAARATNARVEKAATRENMVLGVGSAGECARRKRTAEAARTSVSAAAACPSSTLSFYRSPQTHRDCLSPPLPPFFTFASVTRRGPRARRLPYWRGGTPETTARAARKEAQLCLGAERASAQFESQSLDVCETRHEGHEDRARLPKGPRLATAYPSLRAQSNASRSSTTAANVIMVYVSQSRGLNCSERELAGDRQVPY